MYQWIRVLRHLLNSATLRFRYPVSLPEDIAEALGLPLANSLSFNDFILQLCQPACPPTRLSRFMPREEAEKSFLKAVRKERYAGKTVLSYYFSEGWMEIILQFDKESRLRRVYLHHREIPSERGVELRLIAE
jgi:hypothetical protein